MFQWKKLLVQQGGKNKVQEEVQRSAEEVAVSTSTAWKMCRDEL
jgi:hypothetical protein